MNKESFKNFWLTERGQWIFLTVFAVIVFFVNLQSEGLFSAQEGRAAVIARNMLATGDWTTMHYKGALTTEKPIFCYWLYSICGMIFGVNEFSVRFPSAISAILTILMTVWLGKKIYGTKTGFLAGYLLCTMMTFVNLGRTARIDIVLTAFYMFAMLCLYRGFWEKNRPTWWLYLFYVTLGLSVMVKGPVGVVMAGFLIFCYGCIFRKWKLWWDLKPISGVIIVISISAPWYIYESIITHGGFAWDFLIQHNILRFTGGSEYKDGIHQPLYYYFGKFFAGALPWSIAVPFLLFQFRKKYKHLRQETWFLALWFLTGFVFFTIAAVKRGDYILPLYPAAAIIISRYLVLLEDIKYKLHNKWIYGWGAVVAVCVGIGVVIRAGLLYKLGKRATGNDFPHLSVKDGLGMMEASNLINHHFIIFSVFLIIVIVIMFFICRLLADGKFLKAISWFLPGLLLAMVLYFQIVQEVIDRYNTTKYFCRKAMEIVPENKKILYLLNLNSEVVYFLQRDYDFAYDWNDVHERLKNADYVVMQYKHFNHQDMSESPYDQFMVGTRTIQGHNDPQVLLVRKGLIESEQKVLK